MNSIQPLKTAFLLILFLITSCDDYEIEYADTTDDDLGYYTTLNLQSQKQVDNFGKNNYTKISGDLIISDDNDNSNNITNLDALISLEEIRGSLIIRNCSSLRDINGLSSLKTIGLNIDLNYNEVLTHIDALNNIVSVNYISLQYNTSLLNLDGFASLTTINDRFILESNKALIHLDGLSNLNSIGNEFEISYNNTLNNLDGLSNLKTVGGQLSIIANDNLVDYCGLQELAASGNTEFSVYSNASYNAFIYNIAIPGPGGCSKPTTD